MWKWNLIAVYQLWPWGLKDHSGWDNWTPKGAAQTTYIFGMVVTFLMIACGFFGMAAVRNQSVSKWETGYEVTHDDNAQLTTVRRMRKSDMEPRHVMKGGRTDQPFHWMQTKGDDKHIAYLAFKIFFLASIVHLMPAISIYPIWQSGRWNGLQDVLVWAFKIVAGLGWMTSKYFLMVESAGSWIRPKLTMGYFSSLIQCIGYILFIVHACLGFARTRDARLGYQSDTFRYGSSLCLFISSIFLVVGSSLQWMEFCALMPANQKKKN